MAGVLYAALGRMDKESQMRGLPFDCGHDSQTRTRGHIQGQPPACPRVCSGQG